MQWDIFCRVIDNLGDLGVCWRLCADLAERGQTLRLWVDDASALSWMAPGALQDQWPGVKVLDWDASKSATDVAQLVPSQVWVEAFACDVPEEFVAARASSRLHDKQGEHEPVAQPAWINLEYLSAESYVERAHGLPSPILQGPARGWTKHFFYPGFTHRTGGLLREQDLQARQEHFDAVEWLAQMGLPHRHQERLVSLFCYEPAALTQLLYQFASNQEPTHLLVTAGRAHAAVLDAVARLNASHPQWNQREALAVSYLPYLSQHDFDHLLWACDLNFVRGEDSLVRALWAGKPLVWQIYPQDDLAHHAKLEAFLDLIPHAGLDPDPVTASLAWQSVLPENPGLPRRARIDGICAWREFHKVWNGIEAPSSEDVLPIAELKNWSEIVQSARTRLLKLGDLSGQLLRFVEKKR